MENGKRYKIRQFKDPFTGEKIRKQYERIDSATGSVYHYDNDPDISGNEYKIDSLYASPGDTMKSSREPAFQQENFSTICLETHTDTVLGIPVEIKTFEDQSFIPGLNYSLAKGFGLINDHACEFGCGSTKLVYAVIDGVEYGDKITSVEDHKKNTINFQLFPNYPNPFNPETTIKYSIPSSNKNVLVTLKIYDILGKRIKTLVNIEQSSGIYEIKFNGAGLASGVYLYKLNAGNSSDSKKFILMK